jgi:hypothetical protein
MNYILYINVCKFKYDRLVVVSLTVHDTHCCSFLHVIGRNISLGIATGILCVTAYSSSVHPFLSFYTPSVTLYLCTVLKLVYLIHIILASRFMHSQPLCVSH